MLQPANLPVDSDDRAKNQRRWSGKCSVTSVSARILSNMAEQDFLQGHQSLWGRYMYVKKIGLKGEFLSVILFIVAVSVLCGSALSVANERLQISEKSTLTVINNKIRGPLLLSEGGEKQDHISRKMSILASEQRFDIIEETEVLMGDKKISMDDLPVPCRAQIIYQPLRKYNANVLQIKVLKVLAGASTRWPVQQAE